MKVERALSLVQDELDAARSNHPPMRSCHEGYAIMLEEVDELWLEVKSGNGSSHRGVSEAVQVAAMALRFLVDLCDEESAISHSSKVVRHHQGSGSIGGYSG